MSRLLLLNLSACAVGLLFCPLANADPASPSATPADAFSVAEGFTIKMVHAVKSKSDGDNPAEGSWVAMTVDPKGRLIASDQGGGLFRLDVSQTPAKVERLQTPIVGAQGLLCAHGSLYANVNSGKPSGLWRLTDTNGDDQYDKHEHIIPLKAGGEHGPHGLVLTPDGKRIVMVVGNMSSLPKLARSRPPQNWDEDQLLPRMPDARGHAANRFAPGGYLMSCKPDGSDTEMICNGFRNPYDLAYNADGELFTFDADMEWDIGTPWYRPTRIVHAIGGADFGWRNGTGKWPAYYPDSYGAAVNVGPGSPTGICFGYGAKFPAKYQNALFACDWSYGKLYAVFLKPEGSSYTGEFEVFASAAPLPITDITVHPDGAMYFVMGGRGTQSAVYRIRYTGDQQTRQAKQNLRDPIAAGKQISRHYFERLQHGYEGNTAVLSQYFFGLADTDRGVRHAARVALEHMSTDAWKDKLASLHSDQAKILGVVALARVGEKADKKIALETLRRIDWDSLSASERIDALRAIGLVAIRMHGFDDEATEALISRLSPSFPTGNSGVDRELARLLVYLKDESATPRIVGELMSSPDQENQIYYAMVLRQVESGWTDELRRDYLRWFVDIQGSSGGMSFGGFINNIKKEAIENLTDQQKTDLAEVINAKPKKTETKVAKLDFVRAWKTDELINAVSKSDRKADFDRGKTLFIAGACYGCHRIGMQGGILGPDLTGAGGRFNTHDLIQAVVEPSKVISDQYAAKQFLTHDGDIIVGTVVNMRGTKLQVMTNMLDPSSLKTVNTDDVEIIRDAKTSMMPSGLMDSFSADDVVDLITYLKAGGNARHPIYQNAVIDN